MLYAAAWICGEFAEHLPNAEETLSALFRGKVASLSGHIQAVYIQNGVKLFAFIARGKLASGEEEGKKQEV